MNPEITPELLAAAPVGSTIRGADDVLAVKDGDGAPGAHNLRPWLVLGDDVWRNDADMAAFAIADRGAANVRLVWPADTTAAQRMGAHLDQLVPVPLNESAGPSMATASALLSIVESVRRDGHAVRAYGVRISRPEPEVTEPTPAPTLPRYVDDSRIDGTTVVTATVEDNPYTLGEWYQLDERTRHEQVRRLTIEAATHLGATWAREQAAAELAAEQATALRRMLADVLHGTAEAVGL